MGIVEILKTAITWLYDHVLSFTEYEYQDYTDYLRQKEDDDKRSKTDQRATRAGDN
jgi:hypothetical protein